MDEGPIKLFQSFQNSGDPRLFSLGSFSFFFYFSNHNRKRLVSHSNCETL